MKRKPPNILSEPSLESLPYVIAVWFIGSILLGVCLAAC